MHAALRKENRSRLRQSLLTLAKRPALVAPLAERAKDRGGNALYQPLTHANQAQVSELLMRQAHFPTSAGFLGLQSLSGNQAVQSMLEDVAASLEPEKKPCSCGGSCSGCAQEKGLISSLLTIQTEPLEAEDLEELQGEAVTTPPELSWMGDTMGAPIATLPSSSSGGTVICNKGNMEVWINPTMDPCVVPCARKHEEKHIADFQADPNYKDACKGVPDGHMANGGRYNNCDDGVRYENAASDLEIDCLTNAIPGASASCKSIMQNRKDVTLPNYKKQVKSSCGC